MTPSRRIWQTTRLRKTILVAQRVDFLDAVVFEGALSRARTVAGHELVEGAVVWGYGDFGGGT